MNEPDPKEDESAPATDPPEDPAGELPDAQATGEALDDDDPDDGDDDGGPVVLKPFPGMSHNSIFGGGSFGGIGGLEGAEGASYLGELPGEVLLKVEGPPRSSRGLVLGLVASAALVAAPCLLFWDSRAQAKLAKNLGGLSPETFVPTAVGLVLAGLLLGAWQLLKAVFSGAQVTFTSEGVGVQGSAEATWIPWEKLVGYRSESELFVLRGTEQEVSFLVTPDELARVRDLLDERGLDRLD